jgi:hypothetical protein
MSLEIKQHTCEEPELALKGSKRQIQFIVNEMPDLLNKAISQTLGIPLALQWVSPLKADRYREYWDSAFLKSLKMSRFEPELCNFWPNGGPHWDALARAKSDAGAEGVVLVEAKSHIAEMYAGGSKAKSGSRALEKIDVAIARTKAWLNVDSSADWRGSHPYLLNGREYKGSLYQMANRLAHLYFFRKILGIDAWLVNVYFVNDPYKPTSIADWQAGIANSKRALKLANTPFCADALMKAAG